MMIYETEKERLLVWLISKLGSIYLTTQKVRDKSSLVA